MTRAGKILKNLKGSFLATTVSMEDSEPYIYSSPWKEHIERSQQVPFMWVSWSTLEALLHN